MLPDRLRTCLARFRRSESGTLSVEAVLIFPLLLWAYAAMFIYWDAFKTQNVNLKATYTIADMISRESEPVTQAYIDGMNTIYQFLIKRDDGNDVRVTIVRMGLASDGVTPELELSWSEATGSFLPYADVTQIRDAVPMMAVGDEMIVVETRMTWNPPFNFTLENIGLGTMELTNRVFTKARFVPQTEWDDGLSG